MIMQRVLVVVIAGLLLSPAAEGAPDERLMTALAAVRRDVAAVRQAVSDGGGAGKNMNEICFRVGTLYATLHGLAEFASPRGFRSVRELVAGSKALPSFCGDRVDQQSGYEGVPPGDIGRLKAELADIERRTTLSRAPLP
jgi:hypothetical protein